MDRVIPKILGTMRAQRSRSHHNALQLFCHVARSERSASAQCRCRFRRGMHIFDTLVWPLTTPQAMKELARGERTAAALEDHLDSLEKKIEELLAQAEKAEKDMQTGASTSEKPSSQDQSKSS